jgi:ribonucleoside-diphosphate reductase alpha chain
MAKIRGPFEEWDESKWANPDSHPDWFETHAHQQPHEVDDNGYLMRNHNVTTIAPTGTTSMIGDTTGGCEPLYQVAYLKNVGDDIQGEENLVEFDSYFLRTLEANDIDVDAVKREVKDQMVSDDKTFEGADSLETVPQDIGDLFVTTTDLSGEQHIRMQAAFQEYCDSGISKTLNLANSATYEDVSEAFSMALDMGIKGTTVYRTGSREEEVKKENVDNYQEEDLGDVADEQLVQHLVDQRNLSVKAEQEIREDLGVVPEEGEVQRECDECGSGLLDMSEGCPICMACGYSPCS